jgi:hypothetical protein
MSSARFALHVKQSRIFACVAVAVAMPAMAQLPGAPVLQNAWAAPGIVGALDLAGGGGGGGRASGGTYAVAAGWAPANARFQISAGGGIQSGGGLSRGVYGARVAFSVLQMMNGNLGLGAFVGAGGGPVPAGDSVTAKSVLPAGVAIGYRLAMGSSGRGFSVYTDPQYQREAGAKNSSGVFRVGIGVDAGITPRLGATLGLETGSSAPAGKTGPHGSSFGLGISMKFGH